MTTETIALSNQVEQLNWDEILRELDNAWNHLPEQALRTCQRHAEQAIPRLIAVLEEAARLGREGKTREGCAPYLAILLLTEFQAKAALPAILDVYSLQEPVLGELLGDGITEDPRRVLAVLTGDQPDRIERMIADQNLDQFIRWEAAAAICQLVRDGRLTRTEGLERLMRQLRAAITAADHWALEIVLSEIGYLNPLEAADEIKAGFDQGLFRQTEHTWRDFEEYSFDPDQPGVCPRLANWDEGAIHDTVEEIRSWYRPSGIDEFADRPADDWDKDDELLEGEDLLNFPPRESAGSFTIRRDAPHVGRNDPCPCGSGKKYKKCCLRAGDIE